MSFSSANPAPTSAIPYLPNELKIRILSFIDDPHFLWTTCRSISPAFKQWSEEQYARDHLSKLRLEMHAQSSPSCLTQHQNNVYYQDHSEFLFFFDKLFPDDPKRAILKPRGPPYTSLARAFQPMRERGRKNIMVKRMKDFAILSSQETRVTGCQVYPESELGLRPQGQKHVCPCRSLKNYTKRVFCVRYLGAERFMEWRVEGEELEGPEGVMVLKWMELLDFVHEGTCKSPTWTTN